MNPYPLIVGVNKDEPFELVGNYVRLKTGSVPITIKTQNNEEVALVQGEWAQLKRFTYLFLSHDDASEQEIVLEIGNGTSKGSSQVGGSIQVTGGSDNTASPPIVKNIIDPLKPQTLVSNFCFALTSALSTIVTPAANVNGVRIDCIMWSHSGAATARVMAKTSAPTVYNDASARMLASYSVHATYGEETLPREQSFIIPAGEGLYAQTNGAGADVSIDYKIL